jgi:hypothetical protein
MSAAVVWLSDDTYGAHVTTSLQQSVDNGEHHCGDPAQQESNAKALSDLTNVPGRRGNTTGQGQR